MAVMVEGAAAALTAAWVVAFTVVEVEASVAEVPTAAMVANVQLQCPEVVVDPEGTVEDRHQPQQEDHPQSLGLIHLRDGTRLVDRATAAVVGLQVTKWPLPTVSGTLLEASTRQVDRLSQRTPTLPGTPASCTALAGEAREVGVVAGAAGEVVGDILPSDSAGDVGVADGDLVLVGASAGARIGR